MKTIKILALVGFTILGCSFYPIFKKAKPKPVNVDFAYKYYDPKFGIANPGGGFYRLGTFVLITYKDNTKREIVGIERDHNIHFNPDEVKIDVSKPATYLNKINFSISSGVQIKKSKEDLSETEIAALKVQLNKFFFEKWTGAQWQEISVPRQVVLKMHPEDMWFHIKSVNHEIQDFGIVTEVYEADSYEDIVNDSAAVDHTLVLPKLGGFKINYNQSRQNIKNIRATVGSDKVSLFFKVKAISGFNIEQPEISNPNKAVISFFGKSMHEVTYNPDMKVQGGSND